MDVHLARLAAGQRDLVAAWQLLRAGWTIKAIEWHAANAGWRRVHSGVYALTQSPLSIEQRRMAATLTAPNTFLCRFSAGAHYAIWTFDAGYEMIVRHGNRGRNRSDGVLIRYSTTLNGDVGIYKGIPITSPERTLIDLAVHADPARALREARRLKLLTPYSLAASLRKHSGRPGTKWLAELNDRYAGLPYSRCRSNAEAKALEVLHDAGAEPPDVNERVNGEEADLSWPRHRRIVEIDGAQFHQISAEDARKQAIWENADFTVERISSDDVYDRPERLIRLAPRRVLLVG
jgi:hypothetical protein